MSNQSASHPALGQLDTSFQRLPNQLRTLALKPSAAYLFRNLNRVRCMCAYSPRLVYLTRAWEEVRSAAINDVDWSALDETEQSMRIGHYVAMRFAKDLDGDDQFVTTVPTAIVDQLVSMGRFTALGEGNETMCAAMLLHIWTAFEAFAEDLWIAAMNCAPLAMAADLLGKAKVLDGNAIRRYGLDLRGRLGTIMADQQVFGFDKLDKIQTAYGTAFPEIDGALLSSVELRTLEALRNVIIHNGAIADERFLSRVKNHPTLSALNLGATVDITGRQVEEYFNAVAATCTRLANLVDAALTIEELPVEGAFRR